MRQARAEPAADHAGEAAVRGRSAGRVVAVNRFYSPDHSATAQILADLAEHLVEEGHEVEIITSRLTYDGAQRLPARETINGVNVRRVWTSRFGRANLAGRSIDYLTFYASAFAAMLGRVRKGDVLIAKTDPPLISVVAAIAARIKGARLVNWCQDLFPEIAGALGVSWANGPFGNVLRMLRNASLKAADVNAVLHETMAKRLVAEGVAAARIRILPNWSDREIRPVAHNDNPLRAQWGLGDKFVIAYSGNLGRAHMPDRVADLVARTIDIERLAWLFIGGGAGVNAVRETIGDHPDLHFRPYQKRADLSLSLSVGDAHLVSLDPACEGLMVPSKLYGVLAAGRPVIFLGASSGAVACDIARLNAGVRLSPDQPQNWREAIEAFVEGAHTNSQALTAIGDEGQDGAGIDRRGQAGTLQALDAWTSALGAIGAGRSSGDLARAPLSRLAR